MSESKPLRVAVVGSGPSGIYAIESLLDKRGLDVEIDLYERLPNPWGLVRAGVAPDHPEKKLIIDRLFRYFLNNERVRFIGNVEVGRDIRHAELAQWYHAVIYAVGATSDTRMGIPGEDLAGCWAAREFVAWYNGHPDYSHLQFDLSCERAMVVGNGNVALDVARILTAPIETLSKTEIADHALQALRDSKIREVVVLGRRGHLQGAFNNPELEELEHLDGVEIAVEGHDLPAPDDIVMDGATWETQRKIATLRHLAQRRPSNAQKRIVLRFLTSPIELVGDGKVEQVLLVRNHLERDAAGNLAARPTDEQEVMEAGLILRAIGYRGTPFPGLPFDERNGVIRNQQGRVVDDHQAVVNGAYVTGWIKRGCRGIIGTNKKCARETVTGLLDDWAAGRLMHADVLDRDAVMMVISERNPHSVSIAGWRRIDRAEREAGRAQGRPRIKMTQIDELLACALADD